MALINVDDRGENAITVVPGANAHVRADDVADALLAPGGTLLMQLEVPVAEVVALAHRAHARGMTVVLNAAPAAALPAALLDDLDVLVVNEHEAAACARAWRLPESPAGFVADATERFGVAVVLTLGARGALTQVGGEVVRAAPAPSMWSIRRGPATPLPARWPRRSIVATALPPHSAKAFAGAAACEHAGAQHPVQQATR